MIQSSDSCIYIKIPNNIELSIVLSEFIEKDWVCFLVSNNTFDRIYNYCDNRDLSGVYKSFTGGLVATPLVFSIYGIPVINYDKLQKNEGILVKKHQFKKFRGINICKNCWKKVPITANTRSGLLVSLGENGILYCYENKDFFIDPEVTEIIEKCSCSLEQLMENQNE